MGAWQVKGGEMEMGDGDGYVFDREVGGKVV